jgi:hypothetical protein
LAGKGAERDLNHQVSKAQSNVQVPSAKKLTIFFSENGLECLEIAWKGLMEARDE